MAGVFEDNEKYATALEIAAKRLRQTDEIGGQALARVEELLGQIRMLNEVNTQFTATRLSLIEEVGQLREQLEQSNQWWFGAVRGELTRTEYTEAVTAKDARECLRLMRVPTEAPSAAIASARLSMRLAPMVGRLASAPPEVQAEWGPVLRGISAFTEIHKDDTDTQKLLAGAVKAELLKEEEVEKLWMLPQSAIDRLGITLVVTAPAHIQQAMGW